MTPEEELYHFGVLGMKWGVRKQQDSAAVSKAKRKVQTTNAASRVANRKAFSQRTEDLDNATRAQLNKKYAKEDLKSTKILDKLGQKEKSKYQVKMEAKYKAKGLTDDEAAIAAYQNIKTKKMLAVVATVAITSATVYGARKLHDERVDKILKSGTILQNISTDGTAGVRDAFYGSTGKMDNHKYKGIYGKQLKNAGGTAYAKEIKVVKDIKQASAKNAKKAFEDLIRNDKEFESKLKEVIKANDLGGKYAQKAESASAALKKGKFNKDIYEVFNANLVDHEPKMQSLTNQFFKTLSEQGYNAVRDVNDSKYSGYKTKNPIITFGAEGVVKVTSVKALVESEINESHKIAYKSIMRGPAVKAGAAYVGTMFAARKGAQAVVKAVTNLDVKSYRKRNEGTKLSNTEIERLIERQRAGVE